MEMCGYFIGFDERYGGCELLICMLYNGILGWICFGFFLISYFDGCCGCILLLSCIILGYLVG